MELSTFLGRVTLLVQVGGESTVRGVVTKFPTRLHTLHPSKPAQEVVSVSLTYRVVRGAVHRGPGTQLPPPSVS